MTEGPQDSTQPRRPPRGLEVDLHLALDRFPLRCRFATSGRLVGIFGPSGAGKTRVLEAIAGLVHGVSGSIRFGTETWLDTRTQRGSRGGLEVRRPGSSILSGSTIRVPADRRGIGYAPQDARLFPHWTVRENLQAGAERARSRGLDPAKLLDEVTGLFQLDGLLDRAPGSLSGGERQRVALGRAVCSGARLLLLDEPFSALDRALRRRLLPFLLRLRDRDDTPMLFVSHDASEIQALCDEVLVLSDGVVVDQGPPARVLSAHLGANAGPDDAIETLLPGRWLTSRGGVESSAEGSLSSHPTEPLGRVSVDGLELVTASQGEGQVLVGIRSSDVLLASRPVTGISARNRFEGRIVAIESARAGRMVFLDIAPAGDGARRADRPFLAAHVTDDALEELACRVGETVWVLVKSTAIQTYAWGEGAAGVS